MNPEFPDDWAPGETWKARKRRLATGWFDKYCPSDRSGIDIGCQNDPVNQTFRRWDVMFGDGDATYMAGVDDNLFVTVYASHVIEHLDDPVTGIQNWYRITKPGGHLIILAPHRDLYEKKEQPPSNWNHEHKWFFLPDQSVPPGTLSLKETIFRAIPDADIVSFEVLKEGWQPTPANVHACGEYTIEAIVRKR